MPSEPIIPPLLLTRKNDASTANQEALITTFRTLERWVGQAKVTVPAGGAYASLTGPGQTTTPGDLTQSGGMDIFCPASSTMGIDIKNNSSAGLGIGSSLGSLSIVDSSATGGGTGAVLIQSMNNGITLQSVSLTIAGLPTTSPGAGAQIWNNGGVLNIGTGGSAGAGYASLTGPGQTATPGNLTQAGGFTVNAGASTMGIQLSTSSTTFQIDATSIPEYGWTVNTSTGINITDNNTNGITFTENNGTQGIRFFSNGFVKIMGAAPFIQIVNRGGGLPSTPSASGYLYVDGGSLHYMGSSGTVTAVAPA